MHKFLLYLICYQVFFFFGVNSKYLTHTQGDGENLEETNSGIYQKGLTFGYNYFIFLTWGCNYSNVERTSIILA